MNTRSRTGRRVAALAAAAMSCTGLALVTAAPAEALTNAVSTTTNVPLTGECLNGPGTVNCNLYGAMEDVWLSGLPSTLPAGDYFLAVLEPGGQPDPNDGAAKLLSTDTRDKRAFQVSGGQVVGHAASGDHLISDGKIQLAPYAQTGNPGGVYILAVCPLPVGDTPVAPRDCKYDAFKVREGGEEPPPDNHGLPLDVSKDADGGYETTYTWDITKTEDQPATVYAGNGSVTANYTVTVTPDATTSAGTVSGTITIDNPNSFPVDEVTISDMLSDGTPCDVLDEQGDPVTPEITVAPGLNELDYVCSDVVMPGTGEDPLTNEVFIAWGSEAAGDTVLLEGTDEFESDPIVFTETVTDECVDVSDLFDSTDAADAEPLGTVCATDEDMSFDYPRQLPVPENGCYTYDNTATSITNDSGTEDDASASVQVCRTFADTGARTMGFWQNKNGQGIIKNQPDCGVKTWLTQWNPYANHNASTCGQVATYVGNVIKAANASGASMNAMLKGQMLATALDVYYTGPGKWAGAQVFLPSTAIGSVLVDLNNVCVNPSTCSSFQDVGAAFGGADALTVKQLITYSSGQSAVGGNPWYANNKATQALAKNTFDAINNGKAYAAAP